MRALEVIVRGVCCCVGIGCSLAQGNNPGDNAGGIPIVPPLPCILQSATSPADRLEWWNWSGAFSTNRPNLRFTKLPPAPARACANRMVNVLPRTVILLTGTQDQYRTEIVQFFFLYAMGSTQVAIRWNHCNMP
jgi:hypothetical protein